MLQFFLVPTTQCHNHTMRTLESLIKSLVQCHNIINRQHECPTSLASVKTNLILVIPLLAN